MSFHDHFSNQSQSYARHRPTYPDELFDFLARVSPATTRACDGATGSGQAATALATRFGQVLAFDASGSQLAHAFHRDNIVYACALAESLPAPDNSFDLITVGTGVHWFDRPKFYAEVKRVLRPRGVIAVWGYFGFKAEATVEKLTMHVIQDVLKDYWPKVMQPQLDRYRNLDFPFTPIDHPEFVFRNEWSLNDWLGFVDSWSGTQAYRDANGGEPTDSVIDQLRTAWGDRRLALRWPLHIKVGRVE